MARVSLIQLWRVVLKLLFSVGCRSARLLFLVLGRNNDGPL